MTTCDPSPPNPPPRTLIIGLDGATFDLLDPLVRAGCLPTIQRLMADGARGPLLAWPNMNSAAAWSSLVTGFNPAQHGVFHFGQTWHALSQRGARFQPITGAQRRREPFWRLLSAAGQQVGVVNVPISYPADHVNGFMLAGMDAPGVHSPGFAHPEGLYAELRAQGIPYEIDTLSLSELSRRAPYELPAQIRRLVDARARAVLYLMQTRAWDVLMAVFVATDRVQHYFWPDTHAGVDDRSWAPLRALYQQLDAFLAEALSLAGPDATTFIVSDHGFGPRRGAMHSLNQLLARLGLLHYLPANRDWRSRSLSILLHQGRRFLPLGVQYPLSRLFPALHTRAVTAASFSGIDWSRTQVCADPDGWGIYVNLAGREPEGIVPARAYDSVRAHVRDILARLTDPDSGRPIIRAVYAREQVYAGPYLPHAPDLLLDWDMRAVGDSLAYTDGLQPLVVGAANQKGSGERWSATHDPKGILIAHGPAIRPGARVAEARLYDIAPTLLYLHDQPIPTDADGHVLTDLFTPAHLVSHSVSKTAPAIPSSSSADASSDPAVNPVDARLIEQRLRDLGYLE